MSDIKAHWDLLEENDGMEAQHADERLRHGLSKPYPRKVSQVEGLLHATTRHRDIPLYPDINCEVNIVRNRLPRWQRVRRFITAIQRMDAVFINHERSKDK